jgi:sulfoxide reductase catalytic subunit YedY
MWVKRPRPWDIPDSEATPESVYTDRRRLIATMGLGALGLAMTAKNSGAQPAATPISAATTGVATRNPRYVLDRPLTEELAAARHNIFDEFALERGRVWEAAAGFRTSPGRSTSAGRSPRR